MDWYRSNFFWHVLTNQYRKTRVNIYRISGRLAVATGTFRTQLRRLLFDLLSIVLSWTCPLPGTPSRAICIFFFASMRPRGTFVHGDFSSVVMPRIATPTGKSVPDGLICERRFPSLARKFAAPRTAWCDPCRRLLEFSDAG